MMKPTALRAPGVRTSTNHLVAHSAGPHHGNGAAAMVADQKMRQTGLTRSNPACSAKQQQFSTWVISEDDHSHQRYANRLITPWLTLRLLLTNR
jgi:hypothetical protein